MRAVESLRAVRMRIGVASISGSARTARTSSSPLISGIMKSHTMRSGFTERASSRPTRPSRAAWTRSPAPAPRRRTGSCPRCPRPPGPAGRVGAPRGARRGALASVLLEGVTERAAGQQGGDAVARRATSGSVAHRRCRPAPGPGARPRRARRPRARRRPRCCRRAARPTRGRCAARGRCRSSARDVPRAGGSARRPRRDGRAGCPARCRPPRRGRRRSPSRGAARSARSRRPGVNLNAFDRRLSRTCWTRPGSTCAGTSVLGRHDDEVHVAVHRQRLEAVGHEAHQVGQVELRVLELELGGLDLRRVEQVVDVRQQHARVAQDHLEVPARRVVGRQVGVGQHPFGRGEDQGQGRAELVAHVREELRLEAVELLASVRRAPRVARWPPSAPGRRPPPRGPGGRLGLHGVERGRSARVGAPLRARVRAG